MKNFIIGIVLALALVMGVVAFAETAEPSTDPVPAVTEEAPVEEAAADTPAADTEKTDDNTALQEALEAYRSARESKRVDDLTEELKGYVEAGTMTQEQADLILNSVKERLAAKNGECPNCGYDLRGKGMRGGPQRGGMKGQQQMPGQQQMHGGMQRPDAQSGATPRQGGQMNGQQQMPGQQMPGNQMPGQQMPGMAPQM